MEVLKSIFTWLQRSLGLVQTSKSTILQGQRSEAFCIKALCYNELIETERKVTRAKFQNKLHPELTEVP